MLSSTSIALTRISGLRHSAMFAARHSIPRSMYKTAMVRTAATIAVHQPLRRAFTSIHTARSVDGWLRTSTTSSFRTTSLSTQSRFYSSEGYPPHIVISMPALSPTMTKGNIGTWKKQPGDAIIPGDVLVEIETDKAQMDFECQEEGYLAKILIESGTQDVPIHKPIAVITEEEENVAKFSDFSIKETATSDAPAADAEPSAGDAPPAPDTKQPESAAPKSSQNVSQPASPDGSDHRLKASPIAKTLALEHGISLRGVKGTGPDGRITKSDVEKLISSGASPAPPTSAPSSGQAAYTDIPLTGMRKAIAARLLESKQQLPHYYLTVETKMDKVLKLRQALNQISEGKYRLSVNDFIIKASALALKAVPQVNSSWLGESIREHHTADICVATATASGLITPIVPNVEAKGLSEISNQVKDLAKRARNNELKPHEFQGGTFTISNLGMFDIQSFTAIINPPQSCILAVGATEKKVIALEGDQNFATVDVMKVTLSCDHRVVDGAVGSQWLKAWKSYMENPVTMLL